MTFKTHYEPVPVSEKSEIGTNALVSMDGGETFPETAEYMEKRTCMLAGVGGGNGYFGEGWATDGSTGCERGLILSDVTHWLRPRPDTVLLTREEVEEIKKAEYQKGLNDSSPRFLR